MKCLSVLVAGVFVSSLSGCSTPYGKPTFQADVQNPEFRGLVESFQTGRPLDVLLIHGMCTHDGRWANEATANLYTSMGGDRYSVNLKPVPVKGSDVLLYQQILPTSQGAMRVNAIVWSPLTTPLKKQLCYDQTNRSEYCDHTLAAQPYPYQRATINTKLKDEILNDCLSDAMIYQGVSKEAISKQIQAAILQALDTSGGTMSASSDAAVFTQLQMSNTQRVPLVVISESLGSKVAFDAFKALTEPGSAVQKVAEGAFDRVTQIFMGANQLPILAMADQNVSDHKAGEAPKPPVSSLGRLLQEAAQRRKGDHPPRPTVVAFTDPNDLLSYSLTHSPQRKSDKYAVVDVIVSNAPTYFGLVEMPDAAHLGYRENNEVKRLIACGSPSRKQCK